MNKKLLLLFVAWIGLSIANAQENSLLWKVSGKDLKQDSYILGTIHILCPADFNMPSKINNAINNVNEVVFEVNLFNPDNAAKAQESAMTPQPNFLNNLAPSKIKLIDSVLTANQLSIKMFDMLSPATMTSLLALKSFNCPNPMEYKSVEKEVYDLAQNKKISDLETIDFQMQMLNSFSTPEYFYKYLNNYDEAALLTLSMVDAYKKEDLKKLETVMTDPKWMEKEQFDIMLTNRNKNWIKSLIPKMKDEKILVAVGAGHLIGKEGLIELLKKEGYKVTPIYN